MDAFRYSVHVLVQLLRMLADALVYSVVSSVVPHPRSSQANLINPPLPAYSMIGWASTSAHVA